MTFVLKYPKMYSQALTITATIDHSDTSCIRGSKTALIRSVADLEGVRVVRLNPPLGPNYFNFIRKW